MYSLQLVFTETFFSSNFGSWFGLVSCNKSELESSDTNKHTNLSSNNNAVTTNIIILYQDHTQGSRFFRLLEAGGEIGNVGNGMPVKTRTDVVKFP